MVSVANNLVSKLIYMLIQNRNLEKEWLDLLLYFYADLYPKLADKYCSKYYESTKYPSLMSAMAACEKDADCGSVYDEFCDGKRYFICPTSTKIKTSDHSVRSCVYPKGNYQRLLIKYN